MQRRFARLQQGHPLLGAGNQQRGEVKVGNDLHAAFNDLIFGFAFPGHRFELGQVRRKQRRPAIAFEISTFRVDQHRHTSAASQLNHLLNAGQRPFGVIREHQRADVAQRLVDALVQRLRIHAFKALFKVEADQLLVTRQHAQLGDGRVRRNRNKVTFDVHIRQGLAQRTRRVVDAGQPHQTRMRAEGSNVHRHVCRAARTLFNGIHLHHRDRGFRGNAAGWPIPVAIQHHIANHHNSSTFKLWQCYFHS